MKKHIPKALVLAVILMTQWVSCSFPITTNLKEAPTQEPILLEEMKYETNGGTEVLPYYYGDILYFPSSTRIGFALEGWFLSSDLDPETKVTFPYTPKRVGTLYAKWIPATVGLSYRLEGNRYLVKAIDMQLTEIVIPKFWLGKPVTGIDEYGFAWNRVLEQFSTPDFIESIGQYAFQSCSSLSTIRISVNTEVIDSSAFSNCTLLKDIYVAEGNQAFKDIHGVLFDKSGLTLIKFPSVHDEAYSVPEGVQKIGSSAFASSEGLKSVSLPASTIVIGENSFSGCRNLESIVLPSDLSVIGSGAFWGCSSISRISLPSTVTSIGEFVFFGCTSLEDIYLPDGIIEISTEAFMGCTGLTNLVLPVRLKKIGYASFADCTSLISLDIPGEVDVIDLEAFSGCTRLSTVNMSPVLPPPIVTTSYQGVFRNCQSLSKILVPTSSLDAYKNASGWSKYSYMILGK